MSREREPNADSPLSLPEQRSPAHLDEKILAYARDNAPEKAATAGASGWRGGWMSGLATAGVVGVALLIALPQQEGPVSDYDRAQLEEISVQEIAADTAEAAAALDSARSVPSAASAPAEMQMAPAQPKRRVSASALKMEVPPEPEQVMEFDSATRMDSPRKETPAAADAAAADDRESAGTASGLARQQAAPQRLSQCLALRDAGDEDAAQACYKVLQEDCEGCALPPTLEAAAELLSTETATEDRDSKKPLAPR